MFKINGPAHMRRGSGPSRPDSRVPLLAILLVSTCLTAGCKLGPDYCGAPAQIQSRWIDADVDPHVCGEPDDVIQWWNKFDDPTLTSLIATLESQNLDLRSAAFRIQAARSSLGIAVGGLFPQSQTANGAYQRLNNSQTIANVAPVVDFDNWGVSMFDAQWELDFWGRFRRNIESSEDQLQESIATYDDILVSLQGETASTYIQLRTLERRLALARANVAIQQGTLKIAEAQFKFGAVSELDVIQATQSLAQTKSSIPVFEAGIRISKNALCVLLGTTPGSLDQVLEVPTGIPPAPEIICAGVPSELLQRRPDIRAAWYAAAAQSASIGVAITDLYPSFIISGDIGYQSQNLSDLVNPKSVIGAVGPSFSWNILNYGRIRNNIRLQEDLLQSDLANYQQTVLTAYQEVENGLIEFSRGHERIEDLTVSTEQAAKSVKIATAQYENGATDFNRVYTLQLNLAQQQDSLAAAQGNIAAQVVAIYKALGGGWQARSTGYSMPAGPVPMQPNLGEPGGERIPLPPPPEEPDAANDQAAIVPFDVQPDATDELVGLFHVQPDQTVKPVMATLPHLPEHKGTTQREFFPQLRGSAKKSDIADTAE